MDDKVIENMLETGMQREDVQKRIRIRAYELSLKRNGFAGDELSDWLEAEKEILAGLDSKEPERRNHATRNRGVVVTDPVLSSGKDRIGSQRI